MDNQSSFVVNSPKPSRKINKKIIVAGIAFLAITVGGLLAGVTLVGTQQYNKSLASNCPGGSVGACTNICRSGCGGSDNPTQCVNGCPGACANICSGGSGYVCGNGRCDSPGESQSNCPQDCGSPATGAPSCAGALQSCESKACCSGYVCQGNTGSRVCQAVNNGSCNSGGARCGGSQGYIGFKCSSLTNGQCNSNAATFDSMSAASAYAGGCGQADQVWVGGPCNRQLCGDYSISSNSCTSTTQAPPATTPPTTPPATPIIVGGPLPITVLAQCFEVKVFNTDWTQIMISDLASKHAGDTVYFSVGGTATAGSFDKARFTVNGQLRAEVTALRPGTTEFYDVYTIPEGITTLTVAAQIHHISLGWN